MTEVRSTMLIAGIQVFRSEGLYGGYLEALSHDLRETMASLVAGVWVPTALALEHYRAADSLGLERSAVEALGAEVAARVHKNLFSAMTDAAKGSGVTPWKVLAGIHRGNDMNWKGSDVAIYEEGPRQALLEWTGQPCASIPYFVTSFGGYMVAVLNRSCSKAVYRVRSELCTPTTLGIRFSWV